MTTYAELCDLANKAPDFQANVLEELAWAARTLYRYGITSDERDAELRAYTGAPILAHPAMAPWLANTTRMAQVARIFKLQHDDECACEGCNAYEAATDEVEPESPAVADRERELVAALRALRLDFRNADGLDDGLRQMWIATVDRAVAPDAAGQREDGEDCEHGFSWDRSCDACGRIVSGLDEEEPV